MSSKIIRVPVCAVVSGGVKVTDTLQLLPGSSVFAHSDFTVKTGGSALSLWMLTATPDFLPPSFLIVTLLALLVLSTVVLVPNDSEPGLILSLPATGVGVGVGVAAVEVAVGVGVGVEEGGGGCSATN